MTKTTNPLDLYEQASDWTLSKVVGAKEKLDMPTPCDKWNVRELMNHMLETQQYFVGSAKGKKVSPPSHNPPEILMHGWDLARATGQDTTMPAGLAEVAYKNIHGKFTEEQRKGVFEPEVTLSGEHSPQDKLLAYTGRIPVN